ncbi:MAG: hypothetical protein ACREOR_04620 [Candidatus Binatia bacterium]
MGRLQCVDGVEVVVRSYDAVGQHALIGDFLAILGLSTNDLALDENLRLNGRCATSLAIEVFYRNCVGRRSHVSEQAALAALFPSEDAGADMSDQSRQRLIEKFDVSNNRLFHVYGISEFECMHPERTRSGSCKEIWMENIFLPELRDVVEERVKSLNTHQPHSDDLR